MKTRPAKIVFVDIETAPFLGYAWEKWETNIIEIVNNWYMLSFAWRVLGEKKVQSKCLIDYSNYQIDKEDDSALVADLWKVLDNADVVVAHNGDRFDILKSNVRFIAHKMEPPSPYKTIDTLKVARRYFKFDSNKLDELCRYLGIGRKLPHTGFHLWKQCMSGDPKQWEVMRRYNEHDIELLEKLYYRFLPWIKNHPNVNQGQTACPKCGAVRGQQKRGFSYTALKKKQRLQCTSCTGWYEGPTVKI